MLAGEAGAIDAVVAVMRAQVDNADVIRKACGVIYFLSENGCPLQFILSNDVVLVCWFCVLRTALTLSNGFIAISEVVVVVVCCASCLISLCWRMLLFMCVCVWC